VKEKIIIDTDIGDDIDDALAISFALNCPELEVIGITTVFKNPVKRAKIAKRILQLAGREDIPVYAGYAHPLLRQVSTDGVMNQYEENMSELTYNTDRDAIDYIIDELMTSDGDKVLVPIGPLTNIAAAMIKRPEIKGKIRRIVMMGGHYYSQYVEYNIQCDPEAAKVVLESGIPIQAIGTDVTLQCRLRDMDRLRMEKGNAPLTRFLHGIITDWENRTRHLPLLHDPLAVCAIFNPAMLEMEQQKIKVELRGEHTRGMTFNTTNWLTWRDIAPNDVWVAKSVKIDSFIDLFVARTFQ